jgi:excisionase family DNA binding protein
MDPNDVLDARQAAKYLKISERTVRRLARERAIPAFKVGGLWRFKVSQLDRWAEEQQLARMRGSIMIIDDDEAVRYLVRRALERDGFQVVTASNGKEALELLKRETPNVIFLDLKLPGIDGADLLKEIRKQYGPMPVVILTGFPDSDLVSQALQYSPITLMAKPASETQIVHTVKGILGERIRGLK